MDNKSISHTRWKCQYHIVFIPQYRKKVLYGKVREDVREILNTLCKYKNVEIIAGAVCVDHVHLSVAIPPKLSVSDFMGYLKGKSTLMLYDRHPELQSKWDKAFWARGYYVETIGNITDEAVQKYIKEQAEEVLSTLTEREQKVLRLRFGMSDGRARTLEEVGKEFDVTRERIRQIEAKALRKLRHPSRSRKLRDYLD